MNDEEKQVAKDITVALIQKLNEGSVHSNNLHLIGEEVAKLYLTVSKAVVEARTI